MAVKVLALASGVTGLADHRILNGALLTPDGNLAVRGGVLSGASSSLSTVSAMVGRVAPLKAVIPNTISSALGPYVLVSDANTDITFAAGEASVGRVDRVIARAYDNTNDASGDTKGAVEYLKGQASGTATSLPANSILLFEMTVPAGASSGNGGINFANAVDKRLYTTAAGGILPVATATDMGNITNPYEGMTIYRADLDVLYTHDGSNFKPRGVASVASSANLTNITNPWDGMLAATRDTDLLYQYNGSAWKPMASQYTYDVPLTILKVSSAPNVATGGAVLSFDTEVLDTHNFHSTSSNTSRITPTVAGWYEFHNNVQLASNSTGRRGVGTRINGTNIYYGDVKTAGTGNLGCVNTVTVQMNGTTDYAEMFVYQDSGGNLAISDIASTRFEAKFVRP